MPVTAQGRLPVRVKASLAWRAWLGLVHAYVLLRRHPLPVVVSRLTAERAGAPYRVEPRRLGRIVGRLLGASSRHRRCLQRALVLYRLSSRQGDQPELVIGLPAVPTGKEAHAWVEIDGRDVGPPPGGAGHAAIARYPQPTTAASTHPTES